MSAEGQDKDNEFRIGSSIIMQELWRTVKGLYLVIKVSCIVAIIQSKYDLIGIPGSNLRTKQRGERLIVQIDSRRTKNSRHLDVNEGLCYLFTSFENTLTVKEWQ